nr:hypothetical protein Itr_chr12CG26620 [Ipomoea trifida]
MRPNIAPASIAIFSGPTGQSDSRAKRAELQVMARVAALAASDTEAGSSKSFFFTAEGAQNSKGICWKRQSNIVEEAES